MTQRRRWVRPMLFVVVVLLLVALSILATILIATPLGLAPNVPPWWGIPAFTLIAALGGSLLTGVFTTRNESKKRAHEVSRAQADRERDVGIRLATALENLYGKAYLDSVASDYRDAVISWRELQVVARGELVHAASLLMSAEYFFRQAAADYHGPPDANEEFRRSSNAYHYDRIEFNNAMRIAEGQEPLPNSYSDPDNLPLIGGGCGVTRSGALIGVSPTPYLEWRSKASSSLGSPLAPSEAPPPGQASPKEGDAAITARYWPSVIRGVGESNASAALSDLATSRMSYPSENVRRTGLTGWPTAATPPNAWCPTKRSAIGTAQAWTVGFVAGVVGEFELEG